MSGRLISGEMVTTPARVYAVYRPREEYVPGAVWAQVRSVVVTACEKAGHESVDSALLSIRCTSHFVAWCHAEGIVLTPKRLFAQDNVERYVAAETKGLTAATRATYRSHLRRVARAAARGTSWSPPPRPYVREAAMTGPYGPAEVAGYRAAIGQQASDLWRRRLTAFLALGLGAGLRPGETLLISPREVKVHPADPRLWVIMLPDRTIPVRTEYVPLLRDLCRSHPDEPLVGPHRRDVKNPQGVLLEGILLPKSLPPLRLFRLRITWMVAVLENDVRVREFQAMSGVVSAKTLETIAPHVQGRWDDDVWLRKGAGL